MFDSDVPVYAIALLAALVSNILVVIYTSRKYSYDSREIVCMLLYENVAVILGAKLFTFFANYSYYNGEFSFYEVGFSSYGGVIAGLLAIILFCLQFKKSLLEALYIFVPSIPLMYSIGKIGCFMVGCCHGIRYSGPFCVVYNHASEPIKGISLFPVQLAETIIFFIIFVYLIVAHIKNKFSLQTVGVGFILCAVAKFSLDYFRMAHDGMFSVNQIVSLIFAVLGCAIFYSKNRIKEN